MLLTALPPHRKIPLPALSPTMEAGTIVSWSKAVGDQVSEGDLLCEIETDKATMGFEASEEGYVAAILVPQGAAGVPVGKPLCIMVEEQGDVAAFKGYAEDDADEGPSPVPERPSAPAPSSAAATVPQVQKAKAAKAKGQPAKPGERIKATPLAKRTAADRGEPVVVVLLSLVHGLPAACTFTVPGVCPSSVLSVLVVVWMWSCHFQNSRSCHWLLVWTTCRPALVFKVLCCMCLSEFACSMQFFSMFSCFPL